METKKIFKYKNYQLNLSNLTSISNEWFDNTPKPSQTMLFPNWMSKVSDSRALSDLSIPGTHNSAIRLGNNFNITQSWTIQDQLFAGIRYFDIKCQINKDVLIIYDLFDQQTTFGDVIEQMHQFLEVNPKEGIIMKLTDSKDHIHPSDSFVNIFAKYISAYKAMFVFKGYIPSIREVRKKVFLINDYTVDSSNGYLWSKLIVQDDFDMGFSKDLKIKESEIIEYLSKANISTELVANHCSCYGAIFEEWESFAQITNKIAFDAVSNYKKVGMVICDFPGLGLIQRIIELNYK